MIKAVIFDMFETLITHYSCPLYFGDQMAADIGISAEEFRRYWSNTDHDRTIGRITFDEVIEHILRQTGRYSEELLARIIARRTATKEECFRHLDEGVIPLLEQLKKRGIRIGLISNCFSEEAPVIRRSVLAKYFDAMCLSFELGISKPDPAIFGKCVKLLGVRPSECLYVGDGGSNELEAASQAGMRPLQAGWYLIRQNVLSEERLPEFELAQTPADVLKYI